jgi:hypothetical protein
MSEFCCIGGQLSHFAVTESRLPVKLLTPVKIRRAVNVKVLS